MKIRVLKSKNGSTGSPSRAESREGIVLVAVIVFTLILTILGFSVLTVANSEIVLAQNSVKKTKAFYLAEAGVEIFTANLSSGDYASIGETALGEGRYRVDFYPGVYPDSPYAIATGTAGGQEKGIKVAVSFLAPPYECGVYAGGSGGGAWTLMLRGTGNPVKDIGGKDMVNGNIFVHGDVALYQQSSIKPAPAPNTYELNGDVDATGNINRYDSATVSGNINAGAAPQDPPDLVGMNYAVNNTHNVSQIFAGVTHGHLPAGDTSGVRNVFEKNPSDRGTECSSTTGDDYFFEPVSGFVLGTEKTGATPLHMGNDRVYYVDGDVWVHSKTTYGFKIDGKVTIVATGNIHICDNLQYKDASRDMLGLVALGKYDDSGQLVSGGDVFFGDPIYGTMYTISSMMFAANDFLFNSAVATRKPEEPTSGFTVTGNLSALNSVSIERDWYTKGKENRPARYDPTTSEWVDSETGVVLDPSKIRHYQMIINYDDRVRSRDTQPPSLPKGVGLIFSGLTNWEELP